MMMRAAYGLFRIYIFRINNGSTDRHENSLIMNVERFTDIFHNTVSRHRMLGVCHFQLFFGTLYVVYNRNENIRHSIIHSMQLIEK